MAPVAMPHTHAHPAAAHMPELPAANDHGCSANPESVDVSRQLAPPRAHRGLAAAAPVRHGRQPQPRSPPVPVVARAAMRAHARARAARTTEWASP